MQEVSASADFTALFGQLINVTGASGNVAGTVPHPFGFQGQPVVIANNTTYIVTLTIRGSGAAFSNGATTLIVPPGTTVTMTSNGGYTTAGVMLLQSPTPGIQCAYAKYSFTLDGGAIGAITPSITSLLPDNAIIVGATVNSTTAVTSLGSATVAVGTTAGSAADSILAATAKATLSLDAILNGVPVLATPVKLTAAGSINVTVAAAALTAGVIEVFVYYVLPSA
jgi:hypothetical protein